MVNFVRKLSILMVSLVFISVNTHAYAEDSTPDQAMAMAKKAAEYVKEHGAEKAAEEFNKAESEFIDNDLYVFAIDEDGVFLSHPIKPALVGRDMIDLKDVEGTPLIENFTLVEGEGWSHYKWPHPVSGDILPKQSYIINIDGFILGVGAYSVAE